MSGRDHVALGEAVDLALAERVLFANSLYDEAAAVMTADFTKLPGQENHPLPGSLFCSVKPIVVLQTNRRRPPKRVREYDPIMSLRMPVALKSKVKDWANGQDDKLSISKAICRLVEQALAATPAPRKGKAGK